MELQEYLKSIGWRIKVIRLRKGLELQELANSSGMESSYLALIEAGQNISARSVHKICIALDIDPGLIMCWDKNWHQLRAEIAQLEKELADRNRAKRLRKKWKRKKRGR